VKHLDASFDIVMATMLFNFRFDQQFTTTILTRLRDEHQMSQGWGGGEVNLDLTRPDFVQACLERYRPEPMEYPADAGPNAIKCI
jgi:hypothetical protein